MASSEESIDKLISWASSKGIILNGIAPKVLPGRGIGLVSTRPIEPGETILTVPVERLRTLDNTPRHIVDALKGATVHATLATSLAFDLRDPPSEDFKIWQAVCPTPRDIKSSMPICWEQPLQELLPPPASRLLRSQCEKFERDWTIVSAAFKDILSRDEFLYAWLLVNTRTFYHTTPRTKKELPREDHMVLQPVADLFNHSPGGCAVAFTPNGFTIANQTTSQRIPADSEVFIRYGPHSNDFLLVEYGFILPHGANSFDEASLDPYILTNIPLSARRRLEDHGFWAGYMLDADSICYRTQAALLAPHLSEYEWLDFIEGRRDEPEDQAIIDRELTKVLELLSAEVLTSKKKINDSRVGDVMRNSLRERWEQIGTMCDAAVARIQASQEAAAAVAASGTQR